VSGNERVRWRHRDAAMTDEKIRSCADDRSLRIVSKSVLKIGTGKSAVMNSNGQTLWVNDKRNVR
jgi:hypothetical protein